MICTFAHWDETLFPLPARSRKVLILSYSTINTSAWILQNLSMQELLSLVHTRSSTSVKGPKEIKHPVNGPKYRCVKVRRTQAKEVSNRLSVNWTSTELGRVQIQIRRMGAAKADTSKKLQEVTSQASKAAFGLVSQQASSCQCTGSRQRIILRINLMKWVQNICRTRHSGTKQSCRENQGNLQLANVFSHQTWAVPQYLPEQWSSPLVDAKQIKRVRNYPIFSIRTRRREH